MLTNWVQQYIKKIFNLIKKNLFQGHEDGSTSTQQYDIVIWHINKMKDKNHTNISIDGEKAFDKIQHPFMIKTLNEMGIEGM